MYLGMSDAPRESRCMLEIHVAMLWPVYIFDYDKPTYMCTYMYQWYYNGNKQRELLRLDRESIIQY